MKHQTLDSLPVTGKRVVVRADLNLPMDGQTITDHTRLERFIPTLRELVKKNASVVVLSHLGRPDGAPNKKYSLAPIATAMATALGSDVKFVSSCIGPDAVAAAHGLAPGQVLLCENLRFHAEEEKNDDAFAAELAKLGDIYVNDAFSVSHRAHASVEAITRHLPSVAGRMMQAELDALDAALENPQRPVMAIAGGSKVSTKLALLNNLLPRVDKLVLGGAMANTFLYARGVNVASSMHEKDMVETAREILANAEKHNCEIILPTDAQLADGVRGDANIRTAPIADIAPNEMILDVGPDSIAALRTMMNECKTLLWNGPLGVFEVPPFDIGTVTIAEHAARLTAAGDLCTIAGGGDTAAAMNHANVMHDLTYVSTAGGAFLEWLEGKVLPGVKALQG